MSNDKGNSQFFMGLTPECHPALGLELKSLSTHSRHVSLICIYMQITRRLGGKDAALRRKKILADVQQYSSLSDGQQTCLYDYKQPRFRKAVFVFALQGPALVESVVCNTSSVSHFCHSGLQVRKELGTDALPVRHIMFKPDLGPLQTLGYEFRRGRRSEASEKKSDTPLAKDFRGAQCTSTVSENRRLPGTWHLAPVAQHTQPGLGPYDMTTLSCSGLGARKAVSGSFCNSAASLCLGGNPSHGLAQDCWWRGNFAQVPPSAGRKAAGPLDAVIAQWLDVAVAHCSG